MKEVKMITLFATMIFCFATLLTGCSETRTDNYKTTVATTTSTTETEPSTTVSTTLTTMASTTETTTTTTTATATTKTTVTTTKKDSEYAYAYAGFNPIVTDMDVPFNEILLNCKHRLPDNYEPKLAEAVKGSGVKLDYRVAPYYQKMYDAAKLDGITLTPVSGYRSFARQKRNFENRIKTYESQGYSKVDATVKASQIILLPGTSEHNAGLAMDICSLETSFDKTKEFRWLQAHAHEYGFIMRYPENKTDITMITYEPWHYRFVGVEIAAELKSNGMVLEEYLK